MGCTGAVWWVTEARRWLSGALGLQGGSAGCRVDRPTRNLESWRLPLNQWRLTVYVASSCIKGQGGISGPTRALRITVESFLVLDRKWQSSYVGRSTCSDFPCDVDCVPLERDGSFPAAWAQSCSGWSGTEQVAAWLAPWGLKKRRWGSVEGNLPLSRTVINRSSQFNKSVQLAG